MDIQYIGEHLLPGQLGRFFVVIAFTAALAATAAYVISAVKNETGLSRSWKRLGRILFFTHAAAVAGIVLALFYILLNHLFEYHYAWEHSSRQLPTRYILSCFWEGQEGSFLLWMGWQAVLGIVLIIRSREWEAPLLAVVAVTQAFLGSMLLGIYIGDYKIGSNPFLLLRDVMDAPIFGRANYLQFIEDGNGLNPLLQNYWMTIHPPTLFLGFAATLVPFAFVLASLWKRDYTGWVKQALPWSLFAMMVLGVGILMGGAWAYESLTFGGFWAWDPVENASLVPWLTLAAGVHSLMIYKHTGRALKLTYTLFILTFVLVLYSTFLTRSGILGDTSVHAFTDLGMSGQLVIFMLFYVVLSAIFLGRSWSAIPSIKEEEKLASREFWLFIGALILLISAFQISFTTSIPVLNRFLSLLRKIPAFGHLFEKDLAPPVDTANHYNSIQVWVAIIVALLSAVVQFLRYRNSDVQKFFRALLLPAVISVVVCVIAVIALEIYAVQYVLLLLASVFSVTANMDYLFAVLRGKLRVGGASIAHVGFALILIGSLISNYNQRVISHNTMGIDFGSSFDEQSKRENILLRKNQPVQMHDYLVTYVGDSASGPDIFYKVHYLRKDESGKIREEFILRPNAQINPKMGLIANPDTRHYLTKDIYTHVTSVPDKKAKEEKEEAFEPDTVAVGDTFYLAKSFAVLERLEPNPQSDKYEMQEG
ncbi:MAG TPA: cytochrome c biogenesis protein CcsA, partial [Chitinophagales bacterium]|nr:cytochrome c biogenesis protein CcsA [Chitinophagales bacterium]